MDGINFGQRLLRPSVTLNLTNRFTRSEVVSISLESQNSVPMFCELWKRASIFTAILERSHSTLVLLGCKMNFWYGYYLIMVLSKCPDLGRKCVFSYFFLITSADYPMAIPWCVRLVRGKRPVPWSRAGSAWRGSSAAKSCH